MKLLDLTDNLLTELPVKLFERLGKLEILIIKNNRINDIDEGLLNNC